MTRFAEIEVDKVRFAPTNVRKTNVELRIDELAKSIEEQGLLQPILVRKIGNEYELIAGQRRLAAITKLGNAKVPAMIIETADDKVCLMLSLLENVQRVDLDDRDRAAAIERLVDAHNGDYALVAKTLGLTEATIRTWSGYHGVPEQLKAMKDKGEIKREEAIRLTHLLGPKKAVEVASEIRNLPPQQRKKVVQGFKKYTLLEPEEVIALPSAGRAKIQETGPQLCL
jgi:ParB family chromosome partitioning protein